MTQYRQLWSDYLPNRLLKSEADDEHAAAARPRKRPHHIESGIQSAFVQWCAWNAKQYPGLDLAYAIPNGGARNALTGAILKREGVRPGVPDWCLPVPMGGFAALYIEFKSGKGTVSCEQYDLIEKLCDAGNRVALCRSCDEAVAVVREYYDIA
jgi:VRR-NUC domain